MKDKIPPKRILFVCTGNTCRSPMAEQIFNHFLKKKKLSAEYKAVSAGLSVIKNDTININASLALESLGIRAKKHISKGLSRSKITKAHKIICMNKAHKDIIVDRFALSANVFCFSEVTGAFDVPDPFGCDAETYISCANYLSYACEDILRLIEK